MVGNWQLPNWPTFSYDPSEISSFKNTFLMKARSNSSYLKAISDNQHTQFLVELLSIEGLKSSIIEEEFLDRKILQSSIRRHFGLKTASKKPSINDPLARTRAGSRANFPGYISHFLSY